MDETDKKWFTENDIYTKLFQAIDTIRNAQGWEVFEGLQRGQCTVKIIHDGMSIHFEPVKKKKAQTIDEMIPKEWQPAAPEEAVKTEEPEPQPSELEPEKTSEAEPKNIVHPRLRKGKRKT